MRARSVLTLTVVAMLLCSNGVFAQTTYTTVKTGHWWTNLFSSKTTHKKPVYKNGVHAYKETTVVRNSGM